MPSRPKLPLLTLCLALAFYADDANAQGAKASSAAEFARQADQLKPGQWVWAPNVAQAGPVLIYVDLSRQLASVYRNGVRIGVATTRGPPGVGDVVGIAEVIGGDYLAERRLLHRQDWR